MWYVEVRNGNQKSYLRFGSEGWGKMKFGTMWYDKEWKGFIIIFTVRYCMERLCVAKNGTMKWGKAG